MLHRLLIADSAGVLGKAVEKQLRKSFLIEICNNGEQALDLIYRFEPDIILMDLQLPVISGLDVLRILRTVGLDTKVVVMTTLTDNYICRALEELQVSNLFLKPCMLGAVTACICDLSFQLRNCQGSDWCMEQETDRILLELGFRMGPARYDYVSYAILCKYKDSFSYVTKCIYPKVAKHFGGTASQVEKGIRDAIKDAWKNGNRAVWQLYFPPDKDGEIPCPSNEVFLARFANVLQYKTRQKKPYHPQKEKAK